MNSSPSMLFDSTALPSSLGTSDADVLIEFYEMFLQTTQESWDDLATGKNSPDLTLVRHIAHKLKSSSASLGALALAESLKELELVAADGNLLQVSQKTDQTKLVLDDTVKIIQQELISLEQGLARAP